MAFESTEAMPLFLSACSVARPEDWQAMPGLDGSPHREVRKSVNELAIRHGIAGLMARNLRWAEQQLGWPSFDGGEMTALRNQTCAINLQRKAELLSIGRELVLAVIACWPKFTAAENAKSSCDDRDGPASLVAARLARMLKVRLEFGERSETPTPSSPESDSMRHAARLVRAVLRRWPFGDTCLRRVLILACLTRDSSPVVRVGVSLPEGELAAHAWLEIDGVALDDSLSRQFVPLTR